MVQVTWQPSLLSPSHQTPTERDVARNEPSLESLDCRIDVESQSVQTLRLEMSATRPSRGQVSTVLTGVGSISCIVIVISMTVAIDPRFVG